MLRWMSRLRLRCRTLFRKRQVERELDEELQYHLDRQIEAGLAQGLPAEEARLGGVQSMGAITQNKEECREARGVSWLEHLAQDVRFGLRTLRKNPSFTFVALLALALGIGVNTAMFSVAYGLLFRSLPYADADRVAVVYLNYAARDFVYGTLCIRDYLTWKENNRAFEDPDIFTTLRMDIGGTEGVPEQVMGARVTAGFFSTLRVQPLIGRTFVAGEDKPAAAGLAVIAESIWRRRFGARPDVLGRSILVNGDPRTIIGVMPRAVRFPRWDTEIWTNLPLVPPTRYGPWLYRGVARLKPGVTLERAQAETNNIGKLMAQKTSFYKRARLPILSLRDALLGATIKPAILVLTGAVALVLLIAIVNVANLMLARATVREREMALRLSLGAGRARLTRQLLTESVLLAIIGGVAGLALAQGAIQLLRLWGPGNLPLMDSVRLDWTALGFMTLASMLAGIVFGLAPALESARTDLNATIKEGGGAAGGGRARVRMLEALVMSEIALSLTLLVGAGLLLRSFANLQHISGGFSAPPQQVLTLRLSPTDKKYNDYNAGLVFYDEVLRHTRGIPGVEAADVSTSLPPDRQGDADTFHIEGRSLAPGEVNPVISVASVGPDFFRTLGIPLLKGRAFNAHDNQNGAPVTIVSEGFARQFFRNQDVLGKRMKCCGSDQWMQIVGVVGNVKYLGLTTDTDPAFYTPFAQSYDPQIFLVIRASGDAARLVGPLRHEIQSIDRGVTLAQIGTMEQAMNTSVSQPRFNTMLLALFAMIALLLAAIGIYGLIAYSVAQRTREIGVRMALGASRRDVVLMIVRQGLLLATIGVAAGLAAAFALTGLLKAMLFGITATDTLTFAAAPLAMLIVVVLATCLPALRTTRISPVRALRYE